MYDNSMATRIRITPAKNEPSASKNNRMFAAIGASIIRATAGNTIRAAPFETNTALNASWAYCARRGGGEAVDERAGRARLAAHKRIPLEEDEAWKGLLEVLADKTQMRLVRASAAELLGRYAKQAPLALMAYAADKDSLVRRRAVAALAALEGEQVDKILFRALSDDSRAVRIAAAPRGVHAVEPGPGQRGVAEGALPVLEDDAKNGPEHDMRWFLLGAAQGIAGNDAASLAAYERQIELDPFAVRVRQEVERLRAKLKR